MIKGKINGIIKTNTVKEAYGDPNDDFISGEPEYLYDEDEILILSKVSNHNGNFYVIYHLENDSSYNVLPSNVSVNGDDSILPLINDEKITEMFDWISLKKSAILRIFLLKTLLHF